MRWSRLFLAACTVLLVGGAAVAAEFDEIRGPAPFAADPEPRPVPSEVTNSDRYPRDAHEQPPLIPHAIRMYRIDQHTNACLTCHGPARDSRSTAPSLSLTHFTDRQGRRIQGVAAGHYVCTECHLVQTDAAPPVGNNFQVLATLPFRRYLCRECHLPQTDAKAVLDSGQPPGTPSHQ